MTNAEKTREGNELYVPALVHGDKTIIPQIFHGHVLLIQRIISGRERYFQAHEYGILNRPTLAELTHAFFGRYPGGNYISPEFRESVVKGFGEWPATYIIKEDKKVRIINSPACVYQEKSGTWAAEGGEDILVDHIPSGWPTARDPKTGWPLAVSDKKEDALDVYGTDASEFVAPEYDDYRLRAVLRAFGLGFDGPFCVSAAFGHDFFNSSIGARSCRRLEQDASHLATPLEIAA